MALNEYEPGSVFPGTIGRTVDESTPAWPKLARAVPGSPNVLIFVLDDTGYGQQVHQGEAAGAVDDVLGGEGGVARAEGEEPTAAGDGVGEQGAGCPDVLGLLVTDLLEQADRGVEELVGRLAVAHAGPSGGVVVG